MNQSIVPSACSHAVASNEPNMQFEVNVIGNMKECKFYIPDVTGDTTGLAFRMAYSAAESEMLRLSYDTCDKEFCSYVGSMLCSVVPGFRNSIELALNGAGIKPRFVSLPSQARENNIAISKIPELDWPSILVVFGSCILLLFNIELFRFDDDNYDLFPIDMIEDMEKHTINELRKIVGCLPNNFPSFPFVQNKEDAVRTILGTRAVRTCVINFFMNSLNHPDQQIQSLCHYLSYKLSCSDKMHVFTIMNKWLVRTNSPVLSDSRVILEAENFEETIKAIAAHTYPQYFNHLFLPSDLFHLDPSRFPNLYEVAQMLENGDGYYISLLSGANRILVKALVALHRSFMAQN